VLEKSDKCVGKRMRGSIVLDKKRIISNVWQVAVAVAPPPPAKHLTLSYIILHLSYTFFSF
jgi:hypothetical protein